VGVHIAGPKSGSQIGVSNRGPILCSMAFPSHSGGPKWVSILGVHIGGPYLGSIVEVHSAVGVHSGGPWWGSIVGVYSGGPYWGSILGSQIGIIYFTYFTNVVGSNLSLRKTLAVFLPHINWPLNNS
jgi:hypothetical protein